MILTPETAHFDILSSMPISGEPAKHSEEFNVKLKVKFPVKLPANIKRKNIPWNQKYQTIQNHTKENKTPNSKYLWNHCWIVTLRVH